MRTPNQFNMMPTVPQSVFLTNGMRSCTEFADTLIKDRSFSIIYGGVADGCHCPLSLVEVRDSLKKQKNNLALDDGNVCFLEIKRHSERSEESRNSIHLPQGFFATLRTCSP